MIGKLFGVLACMFTASVFAQPDIQVQGLFAGKAVLNINGNRQMLSEGKVSPEECFWSVLTRPLL